MHIILKPLVCLLMLASYFSVIGQTNTVWKTATAAGYPYRYVSNDPMKARFYQLKNGLTVILTENHKEPRIQVLIPTRAGSNTDPHDHTGLAHYLEHMLFKGTDKFGSLNWENATIANATAQNFLNFIIIICFDEGKKRCDAITTEIK